MRRVPLTPLGWVLTALPVGSVMAAVAGAGGLASTLAAVILKQMSHRR